MQFVRILPLRGWRTHSRWVSWTLASTTRSRIAWPCASLFTNSKRTSPTMRYSRGWREASSEAGLSLSKGGCSAPRDCRWQNSPVGHSCIAVGIAGASQRCLAIAVDAPKSEREERSSQAPQLPPPIWSLSRISAAALPPLGSLLFGNFLLLDSSATSSEHRKALFPSSTGIPRPCFLFAEFVFGTDTSRLAGSIRLEVEREKDDSAAGEEFVRLRYAQMRCNNVTGGFAGPKWFTPVHLLYARLLFADGVREVMKDWELGLN